MMKPVFDSKIPSVTALLALLLTACGGGGSGSGGGDTQNPPTPANSAPTITAIDDQSVDEDAITKPILFTVGDAETETGALEVLGRSSNPDLLPDAGIEILGEGAERKLVLIPATGQSGTTAVDIDVTDENGATSTVRFQLTVERLYRSEFSSWLRLVALSPETYDAAIGELPEDGGAIDPAEDLARIRFSDESADDPTAYDDLLPGEDDPAFED